ncbi:hypothetical protein PIB30_071001 [Stylosanthes scabra]|uniref:Zinc finger GRF-type domain-containing protein n=1 Tax=Stylosanthes scabra TaxID=79078 RepID=A0ABU6QP93_9FABA|nr:hypothetical protein [Stylosanthes scabra]
MNGCGSQAPGSSLRSTTRTPNRTRATRVLDWCGCGFRPVLRWSGTESNPNKPFFGCPNYNVSTFFKADLGGEEMIGKEDQTMETDMGKLNLAGRIRKLETEMRTQKLYMLVLMVVVTFMIGFGVIVFCKG